MNARTLTCIALLMVSSLGCKKMSLSRYGEDYFTKNGDKMLACFHPSGKYERSGAVAVDDTNTVIGSLYWSGDVLKTPYVTTVRVHVPEKEGTPVRVELMKDTSLVPALIRSCDIP